MWIDAQTLQDSAVALGLATLSGYSLYGTAFLTGVAMHFGWFPDFTHDHLSPSGPEAQPNREGFGRPIPSSGNERHAESYK